MGSQSKLDTGGTTLLCRVATVGNRPVHQCIDVCTWYGVSRVTPSRCYQWCFLAEGLFHVYTNDPYLGGGSWEFINELGEILCNEAVEMIASIN